MAETRIREALELLRERGWIKRPPLHGNDSSPICVGIAVNLCSASSADCRTLKLVGHDLWPDRCWHTYGLVPSLNDHPDTTWADIEVWMEKAAVVREESVDG